MNKSSATQKGFGALEIVIICFIILALGLIGYFIFARQSNSPNSVANQPSDQTKTEQTPDSNSTAIDPAKPSLEIKEWGVQLPLSDEIKDTYYVMSTGSKGSDGQPNKVFLGRTALDNNNCKAAGNNEGKDTSIGAVVKISVTEKDPVTGNLLTAQYPDGTKIGDNYYFYQFYKNTNCKAEASVIQNTSSSFSTAVKAITPSKN